MSQIENQQDILVRYEGQDEIRLVRTKDGHGSMQITACKAVCEALEKLKAVHGPNPEKWPEPQGSTHADILVRELIMKTQGRFHFPYEHEELCHCRTVPAQIVDKAIMAGAHTVELVAQITTAGTSCGTCRPDTEKIIQFRLASSESR